MNTKVLDAVRVRTRFSNATACCLQLLQTKEAVSGSRVDELVVFTAMAAWNSKIDTYLVLRVERRAGSWFYGRLAGLGFGACSCVRVYIHFSNCTPIFLMINFFFSTKIHFFSTSI